MSLTTKQLTALARLYRSTPRQLLAPPEEAELIDRLDRLQAIADGMPPEALNHWLAIGEALKKKL